MEKLLEIGVFSATKAKDREHLGERVTTWLRPRLAQGLQLLWTKVVQSSDSEFHCLSVVVALGLEEAEP